MISTGEDRQVARYEDPLIRQIGSMSNRRIKRPPRDGAFREWSTPLGIKKISPGVSS